jgi:hypothetical protein
MPDYSKSTFYHIREKQSQKVIYVGGTVDFVGRRRMIAAATNNPEHPEHNTLLVKYMRENGGYWENFELVKASEASFKDREEYKQALEEEKAKHEGLINMTFFKRTPEEKKQLIKEQNAAYRAANRDKIYAQHKEYEQAKKVKIRARMKEYRELHKEEHDIKYREKRKQYELTQRVAVKCSCGC